MGITAAGLPIGLNKIRYQAISKKLFNYSRSAEDRVLIIIRLNGGNDGLSTVIPLDQYDNLVIQRQNILIPENQLLSLTDTLAFHPSMAGMQTMFQEGQLGIVQNVGYPEQNRSHFRSMDIWSTGKMDPSEHSGWLGRYFSEEHPNYPDGYPNEQYPDPFAISMGYNVSETCQGLLSNFSHAVSNPADAYNLAEYQEVDDGTYYGSHMAYLSNLIMQTNAYGSRINTAYNAGNSLSTLYNTNNPVAVQLRYVAQMISGGLQTKVYILNLDGFDTHNAQVSTTSATGAHANLLKTLSDAVRAFQDDLNLLGISHRVAGFTFSEFGRQIASNASRGTDHGDAAPIFLFGSCVTSQVIGPNPVISNAIENQAGVPMQIDFRNVYASVLKDWFNVPESEIAPLFEHSVQYLDLFGACNNSGISSLSNNNNGLLLFPNPATSTTTLKFEAKGQSYSLQIVDASGRVVTETFSGKWLMGTHSIPIDVHSLSAGVYTVRLLSDKDERGANLIVVK